jgi:hypothetical protein
MGVVVAPVVRSFRRPVSPIPKFMRRSSAILAMALAAAFASCGKPAPGRRRAPKATPVQKAI